MHKTVLAMLGGAALALAAPDDGDPLHNWCNTLSTDDRAQTCYCSAFWMAGYANADVQFKTDCQLASMNKLFDGAELALKSGLDSFMSPVDAEYNGGQWTHNITIVFTAVKDREWPTDYRVGTLRALRRASYESARLDGNMKWYVRESTQYWNWTPDQCWRNTQCGFFKTCAFSQGGYLDILVDWG